MIPIIVMTSDKYLHAVQPFMYLFNKYWGEFQDVTVVGFKRPTFDLKKNFRFYSLGDMANYPVTRWTNSILDYLVQNPGIDRFILMLEDYWLTRHVDTQAVKMLYDYAGQFRNVLKIDLCADRLYAAGMTDYNVCHRLDLIKSDYNSQYHMSTMAGIWNRDLFFRFVLPNETPWELELNGTPRVAEAKDEVLVLGTRQWPVRHTLAYRNGDHNKIYLDALHPEDRYIITEMLKEQQNGAQ